MTNKANDNDGNIVLSCQVIGAEVTLNGLLKLSAETNVEDFAIVSGLLHRWIFGSDDEAIEILIDAAIVTDDETGFHSMEINHVPDRDGRETYLTLYLAYPEPYANLPATISFSQDQLSALWKRSKKGISSEMRRLDLITSRDPSNFAAAAEAKTIELVGTVLEYLAGDATDASPVTVFEDWIAMTKREGQVSLATRLQMAA